MGVFDLLFKDSYRIAMKFPIVANLPFCMVKHSIYVVWCFRTSDFFVFGLNTLF